MPALPSADLPRLILGTWPMAGVTSPAADDGQSEATLHAALELGIRWFDTAYAYGYDGRSDLLLARGLRGFSGSISVIGKVGQHWDASRRRVVDGSPARLISDAEESLRRCGQERFRFLLLHQPDP